MTQVHSSVCTFVPSVVSDTGTQGQKHDKAQARPLVAIAATGFGFALIDVGVAETASDVIAANALLVNRYLPKGYFVERLAENFMSDEAPVLIAKNRLDGAALATLTLRMDGRRGLAAEQLYPAEVARLRDEGCRLCEAVRFASKPSFRSLDLLQKLFDSAFALGRRLDRTDVLIEVTPRHAAFYKRILGFRALGDPRHNPRVNTTGTLMHAKAAELSDRVGRASRQGLALFPSPEAIADKAVSVSSQSLEFAAPVV